MPISCWCLLIVVVGAVSFPFALPYYCMRLAPGHNSGAVRSPDGKYLAYTNTHAFMDNHAVVLRLRDANGRTREMPGGVYEGEIKWSPDSQRVATMFPIHGGSTMIWYSITDIASGNHVTDVANIKVNRAHDSRPVFGWKWQDPDTVVVFVEDYNAKTDSLTRKPAVALTVTDTRSSMTVSKKASP